MRDQFDLLPGRSSARDFDLSLVNDVLVSSDDSRDPGVQQRLYLPQVHVDINGRKLDLSELEGHGGSLRNHELRAVVVETIETHRVPPDHRSLLTLLLVPLIAPLAVKAGWFLLGGLVLASCGFALAMRMPFCSDKLKSLHAQATAFLRAHGR